jgi:hypothetical protein
MLGRKTVACNMDSTRAQLGRQCRQSGVHGNRKSNYDILRRLCSLLLPAEDRNCSKCSRERGALLRIAVAHELGRAVSGAPNEHRADAHGRELRTGKHLSCLALR